MTTQHQRELFGRLRLAAALKTLIPDTSPMFANRRHRTERDGSRLAAAELKRARKNAKRVGLVTLPASDAVDVAEVPK